MDSSLSFQDSGKKYSCLKPSLSKILGIASMVVQKPKQASLDDWWLLFIFNLLQKTASK